MRTQRRVLNFLVGVMQTILQHRIDVRDSFLTRCRHTVQATKQFLHDSSFKKSRIITEELIEGIVDHELFCVRRRLIDAFKTLGNSNFIAIDFLVSEKTTSKQVKCETWQFKFERDSQKSISHLNQPEKEQKNLQQLCFLYEKILTALQTQPLFSEILSHEKVRTKFIIDYKLNFHNKALDYNLIDYQKVWSTHTQAQDTRLIVNCYFNQLKGNEVEIKRQKTNNSQQYNCRLTPLRSDDKICKRLSEESTKSIRRISFYDYYDNQLETTVLAKDVESLVNPIGSECHYSLNMTSMQVQENSDEQEFQVLSEQNWMSKDAENTFLSANSTIFEQLATLELLYFNIDGKIQGSA